MTEKQTTDIDDRCPYATGTHKTPCIWCELFKVLDWKDSFDLDDYDFSDKVIDLVTGGDITITAELNY